MTLAAPFSIASTDVVLGLGDSYVEGWGSSGGLGGGLFGPIGWKVQATQINAYRNGQPYASQANRTTMRPRDLAPITTWYTNGVSGTGIAHVVANFASRVAAYAPTLIFYLCSRNDLPPGGNMTTWAANMTTFANAVDAMNPACRVICISAFLGFSEKWDSSLGWDPAVGRNADITTLNNTCLSWLAGRDANRYAYLDLRGTTLGQANTVLAYEQANNTSPVVGTTVGVDFDPTNLYGPLLTDSTGHPTRGFGNYQLGEMLWNYVRLT